MDKADTRWEFARLPGPEESWIWRCVKADGTIVTSSAPCESFGRIMVDAVRNGFSSGTQQWAIKSNEWRTDFEPGEEPRTTRRDPTTIPPWRKPEA